MITKRYPNDTLATILAKQNWNVANAANKAGISSNQLYRMLRNEIEVPVRVWEAFRSAGASVPNNFTNKRALANEMVRVGASASLADALVDLRATPMTFITWTRLQAKLSEADVGMLIGAATGLIVSWTRNLSSGDAPTRSDQVLLYLLGAHPHLIPDALKMAESLNEHSPITQYPDED